MINEKESRCGAALVEEALYRAEVEVIVCVQQRRTSDVRHDEDIDGSHRASLNEGIVSVLQ
jgi:hypothetical protein